MGNVVKCYYIILLNKLKQWNWNNEPTFENIFLHS